MARCRAHWEDPDSNFELNCDLEEHEAALSFHYDTLKDMEWRDNHAPVSVPVSLGKPLPTLAEAKLLPSSVAGGGHLVDAE
jgi:hypothetical protein